MNTKPSSQAALLRCDPRSLVRTWPSLSVRPEAEAYLLDDRALVLVDRLQVVAGPAASACLTISVNGLAEARLALVEELEQLDDQVMHGTYSGWLNGTPVLMHQYVRLQNGMPEAVVRVFTRTRESDPLVDGNDRERVLALLVERPEH